MIPGQFSKGIMFPVSQTLELKNQANYYKSVIDEFVDLLNYQATVLVLGIQYCRYAKEWQFKTDLRGQCGWAPVWNPSISFSVGTGRWIGHLCQYHVLSVVYWVGQKVCSGFSVSCFWPTQHLGTGLARHRVGKELVNPSVIWLKEFCYVFWV